MALALNQLADGSFLSVADHADWDLTDFTLEAKVYPTSFGGAGNDPRRIISQQSGAYWLMDVNRGAAGELGVGSSVDSVLAGDLAGSLTLNAWTRVAVVRKAGAYIRFFRNGARTREIPITTSGAYSIPAAVGIGRFAGSNMESWRGRIADVRAWNVARSDEEIARDESRRIASVQTGLVGHWLLDDSALPTVYTDWTQRGHDASRNGTDLAVSDGPPQGRTYSWAYASDALVIAAAPVAVRASQPKATLRTRQPKATIRAVQPVTTLQTRTPT